jgi:hypothetical protein
MSTKNTEYRVEIFREFDSFTGLLTSLGGVPWAANLQSLKFSTKEEALRCVDKILDSYPELYTKVFVQILHYGDSCGISSYRGHDEVKSALKDTY